MRSVCPKPVYAADTPLATLVTTELLLVGTLRLYAIPSPARHKDDVVWTRGLIAAGIAATAVPAFHGLFAIAASAGSRPLEVGHPRCRRLAQDEARLLQLTSLLQQRRAEMAMAILAEWLPPAAARLALAPARQLAAALTMGGLTVPLRHEEAADIVRAVGTYADRGLVLVQ